MPRPWPCTPTWTIPWRGGGGVAGRRTGPYIYILYDVLGASRPFPTSQVGVIGSHAQRSAVTVKFLPWPRNEMDLLAMRKRVDVSSKTMFFAPTGEIMRPKSCRRKAWAEEDVRSQK